MNLRAFNTIALVSELGDAQAISDKFVTMGVLGNNLIGTILYWTYKFDFSKISSSIQYKHWNFVNFIVTLLNILHSCITLFTISSRNGSQ